MWQRARGREARSSQPAGVSVVLWALRERARVRPSSRTCRESRLELAGDANTPTGLADVGQRGGGSCSLRGRACSGGGSWKGAGPEAAIGWSVGCLRWPAPNHKVARKFGTRRRLARCSVLLSARHHRLHLSRMAAPPLAASVSEHSPSKHPEHWAPMDVDPARDRAGQGPDPDANGAPHAGSDRGAPSDGPDYANGAAPANGADAASGSVRSDGPQRGEKIIKVLNRSLLRVPFVVVSPPLSPLYLSLSWPRRLALASLCLSPSSCSHAAWPRTLARSWPELAMSLSVERLGGPQAVVTGSPHRGAPRFTVLCCVVRPGDDYARTILQGRRAWGLSGNVREAPLC